VFVHDHVANVSAAIKTFARKSKGTITHQAGGICRTGRCHWAGRAPIPNFARKLEKGGRFCVGP